jgi:hypothetical protein
MIISEKEIDSLKLKDAKFTWSEITETTEELFKNWIKLVERKEPIPLIDVLYLDCCSRRMQIKFMKIEKDLELIDTIIAVIDVDGDVLTDDQVVEMVINYLNNIES